MILTDILNETTVHVFVLLLNHWNGQCTSGMWKYFPWPPGCQIMNTMPRPCQMKFTLLHVCSKETMFLCIQPLKVWTCDVRRGYPGIPRFSYIHYRLIQRVTNVNWWTFLSMSYDESRFTISYFFHKQAHVSTNSFIVISCWSLYHVDHYIMLNSWAYWSFSTVTATTSCLASSWPPWVRPWRRSAGLRNAKTVSIPCSITQNSNKEMC